MKVISELPQFADLPAAARTVEAVRAAWESPPVLLISLEDLQREVHKTRGVYETSMPTIDTNLCFQFGRSACQYLMRDPDWRKAYRQHEWRIQLTEVTPLLVGDKYKNYRWMLEVIGEREQRYQHAADLVMLRRAYAA